MPYYFYGVIHQISRSHRLKNQRFESNLSKITRPVTAIKSLRFALFTQGQFWPSGNVVACVCVCVSIWLVCAMTRSLIQARTTKFDKKCRTLNDFGWDPYCFGVDTMVYTMAGNALLLRLARASAAVVLTAWVIGMLYLRIPQKLSLFWWYVTVDYSGDMSMSRNNDNAIILLDFLKTIKQIKVCSICYFLSLSGCIFVGITDPDPSWLLEGCPLSSGSSTRGSWLPEGQRRAAAL